MATGRLAVKDNKENKIINVLPEWIVCTLDLLEAHKSGDTKRIQKSEANYAIAIKARDAKVKQELKFIQQMQDEKKWLQHFAASLNKSKKLTKQEKQELLKLFHLALRNTPTGDNQHSKNLADKIKDLLSENNTKKIKDVLASALSVAVEVQQKGSSSIIHPEVDRPPRSFVNDREKQMLKRLSTQIFYVLRGIINNSDLVEVQIMHIVCEDRHNLFVAANKIEAARRLEDIFPDDFITNLFKAHDNAGDKENVRRSTRYANKLKNRIAGKLEIEGENAEDVQRARAIRKILKACKKTPKQSMSSIELKYASGDFKKKTQDALTECLESSGNIYFITDHNHNNDRHAEEFLCDIADFAATLYPPESCYSAVSGKKRPCMSCFGRLNTSLVNNYGENSGRLFKLATVEQPPAVAGAIFSALAHHPTTRTRGSDEKIHQDLNSESDSEDDVDLTKPAHKAKSKGK